MSRWGLAAAGLFALASCVALAAPPPQPQPKPASAGAFIYSGELTQGGGVEGPRLHTVGAQGPKP